MWIISTSNQDRWFVLKKVKILLNIALVKDISVHGMGVGTRRSLRSLQTQVILPFNDLEKEDEL